MPEWNGVDFMSLTDGDGCVANIEKKKKLVNIDLPTDYIRVIESARKRPSRYDVKYVDYKFCSNFKDVCDLPTIKPSVETGRPYVADIRQIRYKKDGGIDFNLTYDDEGWEKFPHGIRLNFRDAGRLHASGMKIAYNKWSHLQDLKQTIPQHCHSFYENIAHHPPPAKKNED